MKKSDSALALADGMSTSCRYYTYDAILRAVPMGMALMVNDHVEEQDRNTVALEVIQAATELRSAPTRPFLTRMKPPFDANLGPVVSGISEISDKRARHALILEMIAALAQLAYV